MWVGTPTGLTEYLLKKFVETVEPVDEEGSISLDEFFVKYFPGETEAAVCLRSARGRKELTQAQLSKLTGIPQRHISEKGVVG